MLEFKPLQHRSLVYTYIVFLKNCVGFLHVVTSTKYMSVNAFKTTGCFSCTESPLHVITTSASVVFHSLLQYMF